MESVYYTFMLPLYICSSIFLFFFLLSASVRDSNSLDFEIPPLACNCHLSDLHSYHSKANAFSLVAVVLL